MERQSRSCPGEGNRLHLPENRRGAGRSRGTEGGTQRQPDTEQERPSLAADVRPSDPYKPEAKWGRARRESEGLIVLVTAAAITSLEGRGPALIMRGFEGKCEGMAIRPNNPFEKARELRAALYATAKRRFTWRRLRRTHWACRRDEPVRTQTTPRTKEARMLCEKIIGQPCAGKPHARLERGPQVSEARDLDT